MGEIIDEEEVDRRAEFGEEEAVRRAEDMRQRGKLGRVLERSYRFGLNREVTIDALRMGNATR